MTKTEFIEKYGNIKVVFSRRFKHVFTYTADLGGGKTLSVDVGGNADDVYRLDVGANCEEEVSTLDIFAAAVYQDHSEVEGFYAY